MNHLTYLNYSAWGDNLYVVVGLVALGAVLGMVLLNWFFDQFLD
jgi:hypothetical protein